MTPSAKPDIDEAGARSFLRIWCGGDPGRVELAGEGEWSRCFGFTLDGRELVARFGRHVDDFEKDRLAAGWSRPGLPVPAALDIGPTNDGWFAVSERVRGESLDQLEAAGWRTVLPAVLDGLDALRSIEPPDGSTGFGPWLVRPPGTRSRFDSWREFLLSAATSLVDGSNVTGVFDWGCSLIGDPLFDLAWLDLWAPWHPGLAAVGWRAAALHHGGEHGIDLTDADERISACQLHSALAGIPYCTMVGSPDEAMAVASRIAPLLDDGSTLESAAIDQQPSA